VLALPFHLITYTGLITLMFMIMPWGVQSAYRDQGGEKAFFRFPGGAGRVKAAGVAAPRPRALRPGRTRQLARRTAGAGWWSTTGDAKAVVVSARKLATLSSLQPALLFEGVSGRQVAALGEAVQRHGAAAWRFGPDTPGISPIPGCVLFFLCRLCGYLMVATGALLWAVKTRQKQAKAIAAGARAGFGLRLVEALNLGAIAGLPIAFATSGPIACCRWNWRGARRWRSTCFSQPGRSRRCWRRSAPAWACGACSWVQGQRCSWVCRCSMCSRRIRTW
jgi:hypothetical protein